MTIYYNENASKLYGPKYNEEGICYSTDGSYITPEGKLFDLNGYSRVAHCFGFVIPFFSKFLYPYKYGDEFRYFTKEYIYEVLLKWEEKLINDFKYIDDREDAVKMRLALVRYFINCYKSSLTKIEESVIGNDFEYKSDLTKTIGQSIDNQIYRNRNLLLKEILVQVCNYDAIESQISKTITTSKFNINETFYDWLLMDYKVFQIPKKVYNENEERYVDWTQSSFIKSDKEIRLEEEIQAIRRFVPVDERYKYYRSK